MAGEIVPLVMIPRFTTYVGEATFTTVALDVSEFGAVQLATWLGPLVGGAGASVDARLEASEDAEVWSALMPMVPAGTDAHSVVHAGLPLRYLRAKLWMTADASDVAAITCWSTGFLERREP